jgi:hypothetical protein
MCVCMYCAADGERGGKAIETPQDYGSAHHPPHATGRKTISGIALETAFATYC